MKKNRRLTCWGLFYLFSVMPRFLSFNTSCQKYLPNLMNAIWFYNLQKSCVFHSQLKWDRAVFHIWLEIQVPRCAVRGQHGLLHCLHDIDAAWQLETDTDWPASLHLSVFVSLRVIHPGLLKSVRAKAPRILQDTEDAGQYGCWWLQKSSRVQSRDAAAVAIVTGRSNLQSLRVLIESLHSTRGGEWTTTGAGIERTEMDRRNHVNLCGLSESLPT